MSKLSVHLVTWNGAKYVPYLFESLRNQTCKDWELCILDNNSKDGMVELMRREITEFPVPTTLVENPDNFGFAKGHNQLFEKSTSTYFAVLNQDMYLAPDCFEKLVASMDEHPEAAAIAPRLMRWDFANAETDKRNCLTDDVDALGLKVFRSRRVLEQYAKTPWSTLAPKFTSPLLPVFGVSGTLAVFRREVAKASSYTGSEFLDTLHHSYKEDVDLAFRFAAAGKKSFVLLDAVAHHDRSSAGPEDDSDGAALVNKQRQPAHVVYLSYKNHLMTLCKNEYWQNLLLDLPWIAWYELKKFLYLLATNPKTILGLGDLWRHRKEIRSRRAENVARRLANWKTVRESWTV